MGVHQTVFKTGLVAGLLGCLSLSVAAAGLDERSEIGPLIDRLAKKHSYPREEARAILKQAKIKDDILAAMARPAESLTWAKYRPIFMKEARIAGGVKFWQQNAKLLENATKKFGVPPEVIVAIVGVESYYGKYKGKHRVLDALATLGFRHKRRGKFFRGELEAFLVLAREERLDPLKLHGSYAGAMGLPQFIPTSYRAYSVDFDGDKRRDLVGSVADTIGSVANYLGRHGWQRGGAIASRATLGQGVKVAKYKRAKPTQSVGALANAGIKLARKPAGVGTKTKARALTLKGAKGREHWLTYNNFYVITTYNHSPLYAMAVFQLADAIRTRKSKS